MSNSKLVVISKKNIADTDDNRSEFLLSKATLEKIASEQQYLAQKVAAEPTLEIDEWE